MGKNQSIRTHSINTEWNLHSAIAKLLSLSLSKAKLKINLYQNAVSHEQSNHLIKLVALADSDSWTKRAAIRIWAWHRWTLNECAIVDFAVLVLFFPFVLLPAYDVRSFVRLLAMPVHSVCPYEWQANDGATMKIHFKACADVYVCACVYAVRCAWYKAAIDLFSCIQNSHTNDFSCNSINLRMSCAVRALNDRPATRKKMSCSFFFALR